MARGKKWTRGIRVTSWASLALGVLLAVIVFLYLFLRTDFFAGAAGRLATNHLLRGMPFSISIDHLEGSIVRDVTLHNLRVMYRGGAVRSFELFRADEVTCRFSVSALLGRERRVDEIVVVNPVLRLTTDSTGAFVLPSVGVGRFATYAIARFIIQDGTLHVRRGGRMTALTSVNLDGSAISGPAGLRVDLDRGSMAEGSGRFTVRTLAGGIGYSRAEDRRAPGASAAARLALDTLAVAFERSSLAFQGTVVPSGALLNLAVTANPLDLGEIARIAGGAAEQEGSLKGSWTVQGTPDRLRVRGSASGIAAGYALSDFGFDALLQGETLSVDSIGGFVNGACVSGSGTISLARPRTAELSLEVEHLDMGKGFIPGRELPASDLNGAVDVDCRFEPFSASFSLDLDEGTFRGFPFAEAFIRGAYRRDTLSFADLRLSHPEHEATASGFVTDDSRLGFMFNVTAASSSPLFAYFDIEQYRADVDVNGRWEGSVDEFVLRLSGAAGGIGYRGSAVSTGSIKLAIEKRREYRVQFDLDGTGFRWGPASFDSIGFSLDYAGAETTIKRLELTRPDASVLLSAGIREENGETAIRIDECGVDALGERWIASGALAIFVADSAVRFEDIQLHSRAGAIEGNGAWRPVSRTFDASIRADRFDLSILSSSRVVGTALAGRARGLVTFSGAVADPGIEIDLAVEAGGIDTFAIDRIRLAASYAASRWRIDSLDVSSPSGEIELSGEVAGIPVRRGGVSPREAARRGTVRVDAFCRRLKVAPLLAFARARGVSGGVLDGAVSITDSLAHPLLTFQGVVRYLDTGPITVPEMKCDLRLTRSSLEASGEIVLSPRHRGSFRGSLPLVPAPFLYRIDRASPLFLDAEIPEGDFAEATRLTDRIAEAAGAYAARFSVAGTLDDPHMRGELILRGASMRLAGLEERYSAVDATVTIADTLVTIHRLAAREGRKGSVNAGGTIVLAGWKPKRYDLAIRLNDFLLQSVPDLTAIVTGNLRVGTFDDGGRALPRLLGTCTIDQSELYIDLGSLSASEGGRTLIVPSWLAEVDLKIPGNTWIRTDDARVELQGNVTLNRDQHGTYFRGDINLVRGWYIVYNNKFTIRSGKLQFTYAGSNRPVVDVEAETRDPEGRRIYLTIQWHQDDQEPRLTLAHEDAGYSETDIWMMLGGGIVGSDASGASWNATGTAQNLAMNYIERALNSQMQGLTIELESSAGAATEGGPMDLANTKIAVGKYLSEGLYVKYKQGLSISTAREIEVEYRLSDLILLRSQVIRYSDQAVPGKSASTSDEINLDVKLRWEF